MRPEIWNEIGVQCYSHGRLGLARAAFDCAVARGPSARALVNLAIVERDRDDLDACESLCHRALELDPRYSPALNELGAVCERRERFSEALDFYSRAGDLAVARGNHAALLHKLGRLDDARREYDALLATSPDVAQARLNRAMLLLQVGEWRAGWREYEARFDVSKRAALDDAAPVRGLPRWAGEDLAGRRILLRTEQGLGDAIQFVRYASVLAERGATVLVSAPPTLVPLLATACGVSTVVKRGEERRLLPLDYWSPMLSLGAFLTLSERDIPRGVPYLKLPSSSLPEWANRIPKEPRMRNVGLAWAGNASHYNDRYRSLHGVDVTMLARRGIRLFGLGLTPLSFESAKAAITPLGRFPDFLEAAAAVANLDLVITVDSVFAHLAGALGKPVWTLLPFNSDWRWLRERSDSPWYPTMRLYRQAALGDWNSVIAAVAADLDRL